MHYARVPSAYWKDRLQKMKDCGLNAVQTYVPWNFHEPEPGVYNFSGDRDLADFLKTAQDVGLLVILRAGPYICGEWDMGGLPSWLLRHHGIALRTKDPTYMSYVTEWMSVLLPLVKPFLYVNDGPIITVQVENEYGSYYACDKDYLSELYTLFRQSLGDNVVLFTTDGAGDNYLKCGTLTPEMYATVDFGITSDPGQYFKAQRDYEPRGPLVNSEFYTGWLDHWGEPHQTRNSAEVANTLDLILKLGANVNMYMFEGGTSFAFWSGANARSVYQPQITSYDYDAPLTEAGDTWEKYVLVCKVVSSYSKSGALSFVPVISPKGAYGRVYMTAAVGLFQSPQLITNQTTMLSPASMEMLHQDSGFVIYSTKLPVQLTGRASSSMVISGVHDRVSVYIDEVLQGIGTRTDLNSIVTLNVSIPSSAQNLDIVLENMGRINYGSRINESKGIIAVAIDKHTLYNWTSKSVPLNDTTRIQFQQLNKTSRTPNSTVFFRGTFRFDGEPLSTFLNVSGWTKGVAFVNGYNIGRYWPVKGPQKTLYVPGAYLRSTTELNELILFEIDHSPCSPPYSDCFVSLVDTPDLG